MSCAQFGLWVVSDDPAHQAAAEDHAQRCPRCNSILMGQRQLSNGVQDWLASAEAPPELEPRIIAALDQTEIRPPGGWKGRALGNQKIARWAWAVAASLVLGLVLAWTMIQGNVRAPRTANRLLIEEALQVAESAEREHAKAIARLESAAGPILAQSDNLELQAHDAARLMAYRDRLAYLDSTIEEIRGYVAGNRGQARARVMLLAAYKEKTEVLREVLALEERS